MTDTSGFLAGERGWKAVLAGALSVLVASVVALVARTGDPATADTYLSAVRNAVVVLPDGTTSPAVKDMRVPPQAVLRTGSTGGATLSTAGRDVYVGALCSVRVVDGVHQELQLGQAMVDSRDGPHLALATPAGVVAVDDRALARVEEGAVLRLAVFEGEARFTAAGRQAVTTVTALHQSKVAYGAVGQAATPLALTDDAWERRLAANLVGADLDLKALARGLAGPDGQLVMQSASARLRAVPPTSVDPGEQVLAVAVAQASTAHDQVATLHQVQADRADGGSWGVVAALVSARVSSVAALLDSLLAAPGGAPTPPAQAGAAPDLGGLLGGPTAGPTGSSPTPAPAVRPPRSTRPPTAGPSASPSAVDQLVATVNGLLSPTPTPSPTLPSQGVSPSPLLQIGPIHIG